MNYDNLDTVNSICSRTTHLYLRVRLFWIYTAISFFKIFSLFPLFVCVKIFRVRLVGGVEKWEDRKYLVFPLVCLVGGVEKWEGGKLFCLVGEKNERIENVVYIN